MVVSLADVRDIALIVLALESIVVGGLAVLLILRLLVFIDVAQTRLDDVAGSAGAVLESAREAATAANHAAAQVRGSTSFLSDQVVLPAIRVAGAVSGMARFARALVRPGVGPPRGGHRG
jgi:hypothetical protein